MANENLEDRTNSKKTTKVPVMKKEYPIVGPDFVDVVEYATVKEGPHAGAIDLKKLQELEGRYGTNGGIGCDVKSGPCSCGAWH